MFFPKEIERFVFDIRTGKPTDTVFTHRIDEISVNEQLSGDLPKFRYPEHALVIHLDSQPVVHQASQAEISLTGKNGKVAKRFKRGTDEYKTFIEGQRQFGSNPSTAAQSQSFNGVFWAVAICIVGVIMIALTITLKSKTGH